MCLSRIWTLIKYTKMKKTLECSCDLCGKNFEYTEDLITHMGYHNTEDVNKMLSHGYGTVRCNRCWTSFKNVEALIDHPCAQVDPSALERVVIYD
ncbi:hypothetical protein MpV1_008 [Micromonas sp. RCC1109 virus MpV1]|uniref:hypothetical protein n=1 Tax=Micromonas sp. RCC1109 virus MpV1 TaxID=880161 RepID=UPI0001EF4424|nr:hypothetical protein MpV1_008 [Micromonas sp. RCC1109 virus MpV1]ADQ90931.1 hypothetical protein MpV1_008 [Micromonas sp. RCC1109 virus MpV1]